MPFLADKLRRMSVVLKCVRVFTTLCVNPLGGTFPGIQLVRTRPVWLSHENELPANFVASFGAQLRLNAHSCRRQRLRIALLSCHAGKTGESMFCDRKRDGLAIHTMRITCDLAALRIAFSCHTQVLRLSVSEMRRAPGC